MSWTATLVIAHAPAESPMELRSALMAEGRRCLTWSPDHDVPAGLKEADLVLVMPGLAGGAPADIPPFLRETEARTILLALSGLATPWANAVLHPQTAVKPIADRVGALLRLTTLEWECEQRRKTFLALGRTKLDDRELKLPALIRVLHIGGPSPEFASLQSTLARNEIELRPVLRPSLALDEIENGLVDAVLLDASVSPQTVRELTIILRRNSDLALSPVLVLDPKGIKETGARPPSLISDVIRSPDDKDLVAVRLKQLVAETRRRRTALASLKRTRTRGRHDARTGLSVLELLEAHLATHLQALEHNGRAICTGLLRFSTCQEGLSQAEIQSLSEQAATLVARLIRAEDMAAQISLTSIAFLFPSTLEGAAQAALKRIAAVLSATRFHSPRNVEGLEIEVDWSVLQPSTGQTAGDLWALAARQLPARGANHKI